MSEQTAKKEPTLVGVVFDEGGRWRYYVGKERSYEHENRKRAHNGLLEAIAERQKSGSFPNGWAIGPDIIEYPPTAKKASK